MRSEGRVPLYVRALLIQIRQPVFPGLAFFVGRALAGNKLSASFSFFTGKEDPRT
jgi:hypothetical protein